MKIFQQNFLTRSVLCARAVNLRNYFNEISKIAIRENLDPQKFSAIRYGLLLELHTVILAVCSYALLFQDTYCCTQCVYVTMLRDWY